MKTPDVLVRILADAARYDRTINGSKRAMTGFATHVRAEAGRIRAFMGTIGGQMIGLGAGYGALQLTKDSAALQKETQLLKVATGGSREEMERWNAEMYRQQQITGTGVDKQLELSKALQAAGLGMGQITTTLEPASRAMAVAKANADQLGRAMGVASEQFHIDLNNADAVTNLLDQMVVAGRLGNAELENLPDIFARVGGRAREANMGMADTLALVETLSKSEPQAERLATLTDSTLRVFTNAKYMKDASKATGVQFFNTDGSRRDPLVVMQEMHQRYQELHSDAERMAFINKAFGKADIDTRRGMMKLLGGDTLAQLGEFKSQISNASGQVKKDLNEAISNSVDQVSRLGGALRETVNKDFADPLNKAIGAGIRYLMDPNEAQLRERTKREKDESVEDYDKRIAAMPKGKGMSGEEILGYGAASVAALYGVSRVAGGLLGKVTGQAANVGQGVAAGKALQQAAGVAPVYVVNMPDTGVVGGAPIEGAGIPPIVGTGKYARWARAGGAMVLGGEAIYETGKHAYNLYEGQGKQSDSWAIGGAATGALAGGIIGSLVPVVGTALGAAAGGFIGSHLGEWIGAKNMQPVTPPDSLIQFLHNQSPIAGGSPSEYATRFTEAGAQMAQQNANAVNTVMQTGTAQQQAVSSALIGQLNATKIMGNIAVTVSPSSDLLNVRASAAAGNANTQITANVGRTGGPAS